MLPPLQQFFLNLPRLLPCIWIAVVTDGSITKRFLTALGQHLVCKRPDFHQCVLMFIVVLRGLRYQVSSFLCCLLLKMHNWDGYFSVQDEAPVSAESVSTQILLYFLQFRPWILQKVSMLLSRPFKIEVGFVTCLVSQGKTGNWSASLLRKHTHLVPGLQISNGISGLHANAQTFGKITELAQDLDITVRIVQYYN